MQTEVSQILNQLLGLATQVEKLKTHQEQVSSHIQSTSAYTENIERITRGTNLAMEGIARKTDDNHEHLRLLEQSVKQLRETQLNTGSLREGVHQLISDSFMRLNRYLEQRYTIGQAIDPKRIRVEVQRDLAIELLHKVEQILNRTGENGTPRQASATYTLQHHAMLLHAEVATLAESQEKAVQLLDKLREDTPILKRLVMPMTEQKKRESLIADIAQLIKSTTEDRRNLGLTDKLSQYMHEVDIVLGDLQALRGQLLTLLTDTQSADASADNSLSDLDVGGLQTPNTSIARHEDNSQNDDGEDEYVDNQEDFQVDDTNLLFKSEQP